ncbi:plant disease resistance response protein [Artemisia annua]|uniref:Dirigent protein n=2 Tax=Artemisia annua TaxID=35608 RepID=A0A2U1QEX0_ARTAN|nr:plant disease resistance response protein [Artemisia annua]
MELLKPPYKLTSLACFFLFIYTTIIQSYSARTLGDLATSPQPSPSTRGHHHHKTMSFYMPNVLNSKYKQAPITPPTTKVNNQPIPFTKPIGLFPPVGGIPVDPSSIPSQTFGLDGIASGIILQEELEFGMVNVIDVDLLEKTKMYGLTLIGQAKGMYVASSENGSNQMMAMTTSFLDNDYKDELRFFGVHSVSSESHVAVIGGTGKYTGANGYATIKEVKLSSKIVKDGESNIFLLVDVYLG